MQESLLKLLRCPVTRTPLSLHIINVIKKQFEQGEVEVVYEGILYAEGDWFYPIVGGVPRLYPEAVIDHQSFLKKYITNYEERYAKLLVTYKSLIEICIKKNKKTKESFAKEWAVFNAEEDKTWGASGDDLFERFLVETDETKQSLQNKIIFDGGCGNGLLNSLIAKNGITNIAMDFSRSVERAYEKNTFEKVHFIQGDVQFPPLALQSFDIVHCSGVLIHTNNTELSFSCIEPLVKDKGKLSVWLYHHRDDMIHNLFNRIRKVTSRLPLTLQYYLYKITIFPMSFLIKRAKGNKQNTREMMVDILDWFTPQFRWEHDHDEVKSWYYKRGYHDLKITTETIFGISIVGVKV